MAADQDPHHDHAENDFPDQYNLTSSLAVQEAEVKIRPLSEEVVMRPALLCILLFAFVLSMNSPVVAQKPATVTPVPVTGTFSPIGPGQGGPNQACVVGNLNAPAYAIVGFVLPPEEYKLVFDPTAGCSICPVGIRINNVHILLRTSQACEVVMAVDVEAVSDSPECPGMFPGIELCNSGLFTVSLPGAGLWDVGLPIDCGCITVDNLYLLSFDFVDSSCLPEPDLITDGSPTVCTSWNDFGAGWTDLVSAYGFPGNLLFFADAECCGPVPVESQTWGKIKSLYENGN